MNNNTRETLDPIAYLQHVRLARSAGLAGTRYEGLIKCAGGKTGLALHPDTQDGSTDYWEMALLAGLVAYQVDRSGESISAAFTLEYEEGNRHPTIKPVSPEVQFLHAISAKSRSQKK